MTLSIFLGHTILKFPLTITNWKNEAYQLRVFSCSQFELIKAHRPCRRLAIDFAGKFKISFRKQEKVFRHFVCVVFRKYHHLKCNRPIDYLSPDFAIRSDKTYVMFLRGFFTAKQENNWTKHPCSFYISGILRSLGCQKENKQEI